MELIGSIQELLEKSVEEAGYVIDKITYEKEDKINFLRVIIDKNGVVDIDDCVTASKIINPILDEADLIKESYILDVCSKEKGSE